MVQCLLLLVVVGVAACGDDSPTSPTTPTTPTTPSVGNLTATFSSIQRELFNPSCVDHHGERSTDAELDLTEGESFANLVSVMSVQVGLDLVEPNNAENSYLIHKLDGRASIVGDRMPPGGPFLTPEQIEVIKAWINTGALDD